ncbi:Uncharacterised protein [Mycobacteroides abscessus subsp. abscessus]|nr:Uncharacterised protein [Mycobacteroides abscessus subsp. abscessus]SIK01890.1 Uncharacterised protein [Mycobacteroides abscessus subsp. abscessus]
MSCAVSSTPANTGTVGREGKLRATQATESAKSSRATLNFRLVSAAVGLARSMNTLRFLVVQVGRCSHKNP